MGALTLRGSTERTTGWRGYVRDLNGNITGPNGRQWCRWHGFYLLQYVEVPKGRIAYCNDDCAHEYRIRNEPAYVRHCVEQRDRGVCSRCGLDTATLDAALRAWHTAFQKANPVGWHPDEPHRERPGVRIDPIAWWTRHHPTCDLASADAVRLYLHFTAGGALQRLGFGRVRPGDLWQALWQADHIVPVVEGGGECGLDNYRTLCTPCHKAVTAELRRRLAIQRNPLGPTAKREYRRHLQPTLPLEVAS